MAKPQSVPNLDQVCNSFDARALAKMPTDVINHLAERAGIAQTRLAVALALIERNGVFKGAVQDLISVAEAATLAGMPRRWVLQQAKHNRAWASFVHRLSRKNILLDRGRLLEWLKSRRS